jgi:H2-forming N5,N10-methylenetetrahydromethanopterin dehydrogenase-like enzyme
MAATLKCPVNILNPLDGAGKSLSQQDVIRINKSVGQEVYILNLNPASVVTAMQKMVLSKVI